jgi:hypothetical protein
LPAAVSIRWPHSSAVTLGAAGASAAEAKPADKSAAIAAVRAPAAENLAADDRLVKER